MRHCEEHCDEAIPTNWVSTDCFASLAMTTIRNEKNKVLSLVIGEGIIGVGMAWAWC